MLRVVSHGSPDYAKVVDLRDRILRKPLGLVFTPDQLAQELSEVILAEFSDDDAIACLQFMIQGGTWKMRQVAVSEGRQGQGLGTRLVRFSEDWALRRGAQEFVLHARLSAVPFYRRLGYEVEGPEFEEVGIPHFRMRKRLGTLHKGISYVHCFPSELREQIKETPLAILPWGALEWHGNHLPLGLDGIVAEEFAKRLADRVGGTLFPTTYLPITTLPHFASQEVKTQTMRSVLDDMLAGLAKTGFRAALLVSGHYAQGHEWEIYEAASRAPLPVLAASPLEVLEEDELLDHAGRWETACLDMFRPDLVRTDQLVGVAVRPTEHAVLGESPLHADPIEAWETMDRAWRRWEEMSKLILEGERSALDTFYERRRSAYREYRDRYFRQSWEQAIQDWWSDKLADDAR